MEKYEFSILFVSLGLIDTAGLKIMWLKKFQKSISHRAPGNIIISKKISRIPKLVHTQT